VVTFVDGAESQKSLSVTVYRAFITFSFEFSHVARTGSMRGDVSSVLNFRIGYVTPW